MQVLLTGSNGLIGSHLLKKLIYDKKIKKIFLVSNKLISINNPKIIKKKINLLSKKNCDKIFSENHNIDLVIHLSAISQIVGAYKNPYKTFKKNILEVINILNSIKKFNKNIKFIFSSSDKVYQDLNKKIYSEKDPIGSIQPYGVSKSCADLIVQSYSKTFNLKVGILRFCNTYGPNDFNMERLIPIFLKKITTNKKIYLRSDGEFTRDYIYVTDIVDAIYKLKSKLFLSSKKLFIYNVSSGNNFSVLNLLNKIVKILSKKKYKYIILNKNFFEPKKQSLSSFKIRKELKWKPKVNFEMGIKKTFKFYKKIF